MNAIVRNNSRTSMINKFAELEKERIEWEANEQKAAHERLYQIIARTYKLYDGATLADIKAVAAKGQIKVTKATTGALLAAKLVFGNEDTKRNSAISKVLEAAKAEKLTAEEVPNWIREKGGIERIRLEKPRTKRFSKAENGRSKAESVTAAKFTMPAHVTSKFPSDNGGFLVHLSRKNSESGHDVVYTLNDKTVLNAVFTAIGKADDPKQSGSQATPVKKSNGTASSRTNSKSYQAALESAVRS